MLIQECLQLVPVVLWFGKLEERALMEGNVGKQLTSTMREKK